MTKLIYAVRWLKPLVTAVGVFGLMTSRATVALAQCTLNGAPNSCVLAGPITVSGGYIGPLGTTSTASGLITNNSSIQINAGSGSDTFLNLSADTTIQGAGGILVLNSGDNNGRAFLQSTGGFTLTNATNTIQGYGVIGNGALSLIEQSLRQVMVSF